MVISFAAAVSLSQMEALIPPGVGVARVMPNAPSLVGRGMNPVVYGKALTTQDKGLVQEFLATLGDSLEVDDEQMNWCVGLSGAAMRSALPALEGMTRAGLEAGFDERQARRLAAQVMLGAATLALQTGLAFDEIKSLTPMETLDELALAQVFQDAARGDKEKTDRLEQKLWSKLGTYHD